MITALIEGVDVKPMDCAPLGIAQFVAVAHLAGDARARDLCTFMPNILAFLVIERGEEMLEVAPARVAPMELPVEAFEPATLCERLCVVAADEIDMRG